MKKYETIIIGGGISGLACARRLKERGKSFLLITKDIGGRICSSTDGKTNYGASWLGSHYQHVNRFVIKGRRIRGLGLYFGGKRLSLCSPIFRFPWQFIKTVWLTQKFFRTYKTFQKRSEHVSQKEAIESDPYLRTLYFQPAEQFVEEHGIQDFARLLIEPIMFGGTLTRLPEQTAFYFMFLCLLMIISGHEFVLDTEKLTETFKGDIKIDEVAMLSKNGDRYLLQTVEGHEYLARNVVVATEPAVAQKLLGLMEIKKGTDAHIFHVRGAIKDKFRTGMMKLFGYDEPIFAIAEAADGTYVVHSLVSSLDLSLYFDKWEIIATKYWQPMFATKGNILLDAKQGENLWMIGDHNVIGLEDSFITGLYAAGQI